MKKCIFLYRQRYLSYLVLLLLLWPTVMLAAQGNIQIKGKFSLKEAIRYIEETSDYTFFYKDSDLKDKSKKEINCSGTIEEVLKNLFKGSGVNYIIKGKEVIFKVANAQNAEQQQPKKRVITGTIIDGETKEPIIGASVWLKNSSSGTVTNLDGHYSLTIEGIGGVLEFSYIGMKKQEIAISNKNVIDVILNPDTKKLDEVVVVGYGRQKKESVVGAISSLDVGELNIPGSNISNVLSGGGAKGMTHIGIIRALEENNIPIDYITGTSMGAIIGSLYAMGYSPDDMEALLRSPDFKRWYSGKVEPKYEYYFKKNRPSPEFFNIRFAFRDSLHMKPQILPTSMVNPIQMNLVFVELFARATAACGGNFNKLFVPFRCIASDVYNKKPLVLSKGDLGDAVRASMSFPFVFKPIEIDSTLAYDGGIYNNFPTDVMREDFHPDVIIGSVVAANPGKPKENDLMSQLENMIMQKTDYSIPDSLGIVMTFKYDDVNLLDFDRLQELHDIGYNRTLNMMDSIKSRVHRRVNADNVRLRRLVFRSNLPQFRFRDIIIEGANAQQQAYIKKEFHDEEHEVFTYEDLKRGYFRLLADNMISEIVPHAVYDSESDLYELHLKVKMEDNFSVRLGGSVSTTSSNQIYLGIGYQNLNYYSKEITFDGQLGKIYNNAQLMGKIDLPTHISTSFRFIASISTFDYYKKDKLFSRNDKPSFNSKDERFVKLMVALPFLANKRAEFSLGYGQLEDNYFQSSVIDFDKDRSDRSTYKLLGGSIGFYGSTLNTRQYATKGYLEKLIAQVFTGRERFEPGNPQEGYSPSPQERQSWLQISYMKEAYHTMGPKFTLGWMAEALYSSKNFSENYTATMMQAGEFAPTPHSKLMYNEAFRANQYVAAGIKPIYVLNDMFQFRTEFYGFTPIFPIKKNALNKAYYGKAFSRFEYMGEVSVICHLPFGAISAYVNHYSSPRREWNVGMTIGWQLFNYRFVE